jgi:hypothetical protein
MNMNGNTHDGGQNNGTTNGLSRRGGTGSGFSKRARRKRTAWAAVMAATLVVVGAAFGLTINSRAMSTNYFTGAYIRSNVAVDNLEAGAVGAAYIDSAAENMATYSERFATNVYVLNRAVYYTGTRPTTARLTLSGVPSNITPAYINNTVTSGNATNIGSYLDLAFGAAASIEFQLVFKAGAAANAQILQRTLLTLSLVKIDPGEFFGGSLIAPTKISEELGNEPTNLTYVSGEEAGKATNPFIITEARHLDNMRYFPNSHYRLGADVDLKGYFPAVNDVQKEEGADDTWRPIGYSSDLDVFTGSLQGYKAYKINDATAAGAVSNGDPTGGVYKISNLRGADGGLFNTLSGISANNSATVNPTNNPARRIAGIEFENVDYKATKQGGALARTVTNYLLHDLKFSGSVTAENGSAVMSNVGGVTSAYTLSNYADMYENNKDADGNLYDHIRGITSTMDVIAPRAAGATANLAQYIGGLFSSVAGANAGDRRLRMSGISVNATIGGGDYTGGIAPTGNYVRVTDSEVAGSITVGNTSRDANVGGYFGRTNYAQFSDSKLKGMQITVTTFASGTGGVGYIGGFVGYCTNTAFGANLVIEEDESASPARKNFLIAGSESLGVGRSDVGMLVGRLAAGSSFEFSGNWDVKIDRVIGRHFVGGLIGYAEGIHPAFGDGLRLEIGAVKGVAASGSDSWTGGAFGYLPEGITIGDNAVILAGEISGVGNCVGGIVGSTNINAGSFTQIGDGLKIAIGRVSSTGSSVGGAVGYAGRGAAGSEGRGGVKIGDYADINIGIGMKGDGVTPDLWTGSEGEFDPAVHKIGAPKTAAGGLFAQGYYVGAAVGQIAATDNPVGDILSVGKNGSFRVGQAVGTYYKGGIAGRVAGNSASTVLGENITVWAGRMAGHTTAAATNGTGGAFGQIDGNFRAGVNLSVTSKIYNGTDQTLHVGGVIGVDNARIGTADGYYINQAGGEWYVNLKRGATAAWANRADDPIDTWGELVAANTIGAGLKVDTEINGVRYYTGGFMASGIKFIDGAEDNRAELRATLSMSDLASGGYNGGFASVFLGEIRNLDADTKLIDAKRGAGQSGGMFGGLYPYSVLEDSTVKAVVEGYDSLGGVAHVAQPYSLVKDTVVDATITGSAAGSYFGGLAAYSRSGSAIDNEVTAKIYYGGGYVGGLFGRSYVTDALDGRYGLAPLSAAAGLASNQNPQLPAWQAVRAAGYKAASFPAEPTDISRIEGNTVKAGTFLQYTASGTVETNYVAGLTGFAYEGWYKDNTVEKGVVLGATLDPRAYVSHLGGAFGKAGRDDSLSADAEGVYTAFYAEGNQVNCDLTYTGRYIGGFAGVLTRGAVGPGNAVNDIVMTNKGDSSVQYADRISYYVGGFVGWVQYDTRIYGGNYVKARIVFASSGNAGQGQPETWAGGFIGRMYSTADLNVAAPYRIRPVIYNTTPDDSAGYADGGYNGQDATGYRPNAVDVKIEFADTARHDLMRGGLLVGAAEFGDIANIELSRQSAFVNVSARYLVGAAFGSVWFANVHGSAAHPFTVTNDVNLAGSKYSTNSLEHVGGFTGAAGAYAEVSSVKAPMGGVVHASYGGAVKLATGTADGNYVGGFAGKLTGYSDMRYCTVTEGSSVTVDRGTRIGGFVGGPDAENSRDYGRQSADEISIDHCYSAADVVVSDAPNSAYIGGFFGYLYRAGIGPDCYASGDVTVTISGDGIWTRVGGFGGLMNIYTVNPESDKDRGTRIFGTEALAGQTIRQGDGSIPVGQYVYEYTGATGAPYSSGKVTVKRAGGAHQGSTGGFIGYADVWTRIGDGVSTSSDVTSTTDDIGGFVGKNYADIGAATAEGRVRRTTVSGYLGGFVGVWEAGQISAGARYLGWTKNGYILEGHHVGGFVGQIDHINPTYTNGRFAFDGDAFPDNGEEDYYEINTPIKATGSAGGFAAYVQAAHIRNVRVTAPGSGGSGKPYTDPLISVVTVVSDSYVGGLIGRAGQYYSGAANGWMLIENCEAAKGADIYTDGAEFVGGLVGWLQQWSNNQSARPTTTGDADGFNHRDNAYLRDSRAANDVYATAQARAVHIALGGMVGYAYLVEVWNCQASGTVTAESYQINGNDVTVRVGGFVGLVAATDTQYFTDPALTYQNYRSTYFFDCSATGDVYADADSGCAGGFAGGLGIGEITRCTAAGNVITTIHGYASAGERGVGGLVGAMDYAGVSASRINAGCFYYGGTVRSESYSGGLVGFLRGRTDGLAPRVNTTARATASNLSVRGDYAGGYFGYLEYPNGTSSLGGTSGAHLVIGAGVTVEGHTSAGGYAGMARAATNIQYIDSSAQVSMWGVGATKYAGGLIGQFGYNESSQGNINNCTVTEEASVTVSNGAGGMHAGGFIGQYYYYALSNEPDIKDCASYADVTGTFLAPPTTYSMLGGFVGYAINARIADSAAYGDVTVQNGNTYIWAGGFVGRAAAVFMRDCAAEGEVGGGGVAYNPDAPVLADRAGGFVGCAEGNSNFWQCTAKGGVTVAAQHAGGFLGFSNSAANIVISMCVAYGAVWASRRAYYVGGFAGYFGYGSTTLISRITGSVSYGDVLVYGKSGKNEQRIGGFIGCVDGNTEVLDCAAAGKVVYAPTDIPTDYWAYVGGFAGLIWAQEGYRSQIQNCYALGGVDFNVKFTNASTHITWSNFALAYFSSPRERKDKPVVSGWYVPSVNPKTNIAVSSGVDMGTYLPDGNYFRDENAGAVSAISAPRALAAGDAVTMFDYDPSGLTGLLPGNKNAAFTDTEGSFDHFFTRTGLSAGEDLMELGESWGENGGIVTMYTMPKGDLTAGTDYPVRLTLRVFNAYGLLPEDKITVGLNEIYDYTYLTVDAYSVRAEASLPVKPTVSSVSVSGVSNTALVAGRGGGFTATASVVYSSNEPVNKNGDAMWFYRYSAEENVFTNMNSTWFMLDGTSGKTAYFSYEIGADGGIEGRAVTIKPDVGVSKPVYIQLIARSDFDSTVYSDEAGGAFSIKPDAYVKNVQYLPEFQSATQDNAITLYRQGVTQTINGEEYYAYYLGVHLTYAVWNETDQGYTDTYVEGYWDLHGEGEWTGEPVIGDENYTGPISNTGWLASYSSTNGGDITARPGWLLLHSSNGTIGTGYNFAATSSGATEAGGTFARRFYYSVANGTRYLGIKSAAGAKVPDSEVDSGSMITVSVGDVRAFNITLYANYYAHTPLDAAQQYYGVHSDAPDGVIPFTYDGKTLNAFPRNAIRAQMTEDSVEESMTPSYLTARFTRAGRYVLTFTSTDGQRARDLIVNVTLPAPQTGRDFALYKAADGAGSGAGGGAYAAGSLSETPVTLAPLSAGADETVVLQYSADNGATWLDLTAEALFGANGRYTLFLRYAQTEKDDEDNTVITAVSPTSPPVSIEIQLKPGESGAAALGNPSASVTAVPGGALFTVVPVDGSVAPVYYGYQISTDDGASWGAAVELPLGVYSFTVPLDPAVALRARVTAARGGSAGARTETTYSHTGADGYVLPVGGSVGDPFGAELVLTVIPDASYILDASNQTAWVRASVSVGLQLLDATGNRPANASMFKYYYTAVPRGTDLAAYNFDTASWTLIPNGAASFAAAVNTDAIYFFSAYDSVAGTRVYAGQSGTVFEEPQGGKYGVAVPIRVDTDAAAALTVAAPNLGNGGSPIDILEAGGKVTVTATISGVPYSARRELGFASFRLIDRATGQAVSDPPETTDQYGDAVSMASAFSGGATTVTVYFSVTANGVYELRITDVFGRETVSAAFVVDNFRAMPQDSSIELTAAALGNTTDWAPYKRIEITPVDGNNLPLPISAIGTAVDFYYTADFRLDGQTQWTRIGAAGTVGNYPYFDAYENGDYVFKVTNADGASFYTRIYNDSPDDYDNTVTITKADGTRPTIDVEYDASRWQIAATAQAKIALTFGASGPDGTNALVVSIDHGPYYPITVVSEDDGATAEVVYNVQRAGDYEFRVFNAAGASTAVNLYIIKLDQAEEVNFTMSVTHSGGSSVTNNNGVGAAPVWSLAGLEFALEVQLNTTVNPALHNVQSAVDYQYQMIQPPLSTKDPAHDALVSNPENFSGWNQAAWTPVNGEKKHTITGNNDYWVRFRAVTEAGLSSDPTKYKYFHVLTNTLTPSLNVMTTYVPTVGSLNNESGVYYEILSASTALPKQWDSANLNSTYNWNIDYYISDTEVGSSVSLGWGNNSTSIPVVKGDVDKEDSSNNTSVGTMITSGTLIEVGRNDPTLFIPTLTPRYVYFRMRVNTSADWIYSPAVTLIIDPYTPVISAVPSNLKGDSNGAFNESSWYSEILFTLNNTPHLADGPGSQPSGTYYYYYLLSSVGNAGYAEQNQKSWIMNTDYVPAASWVSVPNMDGSVIGSSAYPGVLDLTDPAAINAFIAANGNNRTFNGTIWFKAVSGAGIEAEAGYISFAFKWERDAGLNVIDAQRYVLKGQGGDQYSDTAESGYALNWVNTDIDLQVLAGAGSGILDMSVVRDGISSTETVLISNGNIAGSIDMTATESGIYTFYITTKSGYQTAFAYEVTRIDRLGQVFGLSPASNYTFNGDFQSDAVSFVVVAQGSVMSTTGVYTQDGSPRAPVTYQYAKVSGVSGTADWPTGADYEALWHTVSSGVSHTVNEGENAFYRFRSITAAGVAVEFNATLNNVTGVPEMHVYYGAGAPNGGFLVRLDRVTPVVTAEDPNQTGGETQYIRTDGAVYIEISPVFANAVGTLFVRYNNYTTQQIRLDSADDDAKVEYWDDGEGEWKFGYYDRSMTKIRYNVRNFTIVEGANRRPNTVVNGTYSFWAVSVSGLVSETVSVGIDYIDINNPLFTVTPSANLTQNVWIDRPITFTVRPSFTMMSATSYYYEYSLNGGAAWTAVLLRAFAAGETASSMILDVDADLIGAAEISGWQGLIRFYSVAGSIVPAWDGSPDTNPNANAATRAEVAFDAPYSLWIDRKTPAISVANGNGDGYALTAANGEYTLSRANLSDTSTFATELDLKLNFDFGLSAGAGNRLAATLNGPITNGATAMDYLSATADSPYLFRITENGRYTFTLYAANGLSAQITLNVVGILDNIAPSFTVRAVSVPSNSAWISDAGAAYALTTVTEPVSGIAYQVQLGDGTAWRDLTAAELAYMAAHDGEFPLYRTAEMIAAGMPQILDAEGGFNGTVRFRAYKGAATRGTDASEDEAAANPSNAGSFATLARIDLKRPDLTVTDTNPSGVWVVVAGEERYYLDFTYAFGAVNAGSAANMIYLASSSGADLSVKNALVDLGNGRLGYAVAQNITYTFYARSEAGLESARVSVSVARIDNDRRPDLVLAAYAGGSPVSSSVVWNATRWVSQEVEFRLSSSSITVPTSGAVYEVRASATGADGSWGAWAKVNADGSGLYSVLFKADGTVWIGGALNGSVTGIGAATGTVYAEFRVYAGRVANPDGGGLADRDKPAVSAVTVNIDATAKANVSDIDGGAHQSGVAPSGGVWPSVSSGWAVLTGAAAYDLYYTLPSGFFAPATLSVYLNSESIANRLNTWEIGEGSYLQGATVSLPINVNGVYIFRVTYDSGDSPAAVSFEALFIDSFVPEYSITMSTNAGASVWTAQDVAFTFAINADISGYTFYARVGDGAEYDITDDVRDDFVYIFNGLEGGCFGGSVTFRVFKNYAAPALSGAGEGEGDEGLQPKGGSRVFAFQIDTVAPTVDLEDATAYANQWTTDNATIKVTVKTAMSGQDGARLYYFNDTTQTGAILVQLGTGDRAAGTGADAGKWVYTYFITVTPSDVNGTTGNVAYTVYAVSLAGVSSLRSPEKTQLINRIDTTPATAVNVAAVNADVWQTGNVSFTLSATNPPRSGVAYMIREAAYNADGSLGDWGDWDTFDGYILYDAATYPDLYKRVQFGLKYGRDGDADAPTVLGGEYDVRISNELPTVGLEDITTYVNEWTTGNATIRVTVKTSMNGQDGLNLYYFNTTTIPQASAILVPLGTSNRAAGTGEDLGKWVYTYLITVTPTDVSATTNSGTYTVYAASLSGVSGVGSPATRLIDRIDTTPATAVNVAATNADVWQTGNVSFTVSATNPPRSGVAYMIREAVYNADGSLGDWGDWDAFDGYVLYDAATYPDLYKRVQFGLKYGRDGEATEPTVLGGEYDVRISNELPTVELEDITTYVNEWTTGNATIRVTVKTSMNGQGGARLYYFNNTTQTGAILVQLGTGDRKAGTGGDEGMWVYTYLITVTPTDVDAGTGSVAYTVYAVSLSGVSSLRDPEKTQLINRIDTMPATAVNVAATNADAWQTGNVSFTVSATNPPRSGVAYMIREAVYNANGVLGSWGAWNVFDGSKLYNAADNPDLYKRVQFGLKYGRDGAATEPTVLGGEYDVRISNDAPVVELEDVTTYVNEWTTSNATIKVTVKTAMSGQDGARLYYFNNTTQTGAILVQLGTGDRKAGTGGDEGKWVYTYLITVTPTDVDGMMGNVAYTVYAVSLSGVSSLRDPEKTRTIDRIDTTPATAVAVTAVNADRWQTGDVSFTLGVTDPPRSGVVYMTREAKTFGPDGSVTMWGDWEAFDGYILYVAANAPNLNKRVQFGIKYGRDGAAAIPTVLGGAHDVLIGSDPPRVLDVVNLFADEYPGEKSITQPSAVSVRVDLDYGFTGSGTWQYQAPGSNAWNLGGDIAVYAKDGDYAVDGDGNESGTVVYTGAGFRAGVNGAYTVRVISASGIVCEQYLTIQITEIESDIITIDWTVRGTNTGRWTQEDVSFEAEVLGDVVASKVFIKYRLIPNGASDEEIAAIPWLDLTAPDPNAADGGYLARPRLAIGEEAEGTDFTKWVNTNYFNGMVYFMAYAGSDADNLLQASVFATAFAVQIDKTTPQITVTGNPTEWRNTPAALQINAVSGSPATWTVSKDGGAAVSLGTDSTYTVSENGTYVFTITTESGRVNTDTVTVSHIVGEADAPGIRARIDGAEYGRGEVNGKSYKSDVTVILALKDYLGTDVTVTDDTGAVVAADFVDNVQTFAKNGTYTITLTDEAGNVTVMYFTIAKPNYALIAAGSVLGAAALAVICFLVFINIRNRKAMRRLIESAGQSDDSNKFLMFKKIK